MSNEMVQEYTLLHLISISIVDCIPFKKKNSQDSIVVVSKKKKKKKKSTYKYKNHKFIIKKYIYNQIFK